MAARFNKPEFPIIDSHVFVFCGDGCLQEGITSEASSLAGHLGLGNLVVLYDDNHITIDGRGASLQPFFCVCARAADASFLTTYSVSSFLSRRRQAKRISPSRRTWWRGTVRTVGTCSKLPTVPATLFSSSHPVPLPPPQRPSGVLTRARGTGDHDVAGIRHAIQEAKNVTDRPSLIKVRTTIGAHTLACLSACGGPPLRARAGQSTKPCHALNSRLWIKEGRH